MATVNFKDFAANAFNVAISKVQQVALARAGSRVPRPSEQLALVAERRKQKTAMRHARIKLLFLVHSSLLRFGLD